MKKGFVVVLALAGFAAVAASVVLAQDEPLPERILKADKGVDTVDVSKYPKEQQANYQVFAEKCAKCHTLARPINSEYALPEEWTAYVDKMRHKKRSGIDDDAQKVITDFLIYDSSVRKKDLIAQKLKEKAAADKAGGDKKDAPKADDKPAAAPAPKN